MSKVSVLIPTYNEADNIGGLLTELAQSLKGFDHEIIVIDDNSPDGTGGIVAQYQKQDHRVKLVSRPGKMGLGSAVVEGFLRSEGELIVMMDADFSHRPSELPRLLEAAQKADIVIGSRYIPGGQILGWTFARHLASRVAILIARALLGLRLHDLTSGFAVFRRPVLTALQGKLQPRGFKLLLEILAQSPRALVVEVPVTFADRKLGSSKFGSNEVLDFLRLCWRLRQERGH